MGTCIKALITDTYGEAGGELVLLDGPDHEGHRR